MRTFQEAVEDIQTAVYGEEVRSAIVDALNEAYAHGSSAATAVTGLTPNRVLVSNSAGNLTPSGSIDTSELGYLNNTRSNIQSQIDGLNGRINNVETALNDQGAGVANYDPYRVIVSNDTGTGIFDSHVTFDELSNISGLRVPLQTTLNSMSQTLNQHTESINIALQPKHVNTGAAPYSNKVVVTGSSSQIMASSVSALELGYLSGLRGNVQSQIDGLSGAGQGISWYSLDLDSVAINNSNYLRDYFGNAEMEGDDFAYYVLENASDGSIGKSNVKISDIVQRNFFNNTVNEIHEKMYSTEPPSTEMGGYDGHGYSDQYYYNVTTSNDFTFTVIDNGQTFYDSTIGSDAPVFCYTFTGSITFTSKTDPSKSYTIDLNTFKNSQVTNTINGIRYVDPQYSNSEFGYDMLVYDIPTGLIQKLKLVTEPQIIIPHPGNNQIELYSLVADSSRYTTGGVIGNVIADYWKNGLYGEEPNLMYLINGLDTRVTALENGTLASADITALTNRIAALESSLAALTSRVDAVYNYLEQPEEEEIPGIGL